MKRQPTDRQRKRQQQALGIVLFTIGVVVGTAFFGAAVWADIEATLFDPAIRGEVVLRTMTCPLILAKDETGTVTASFHNPGPNPTSPTVRVTTSAHSILFHEQADQRLRIEPGETGRLEWPIRGEDPAWGLFVFVRLYQSSSYPLRSASGSCGILVVDLPFGSGKTLVAAAVTFSLLAMAAGLYLHIRGIRAVGRSRRLYILAMASIAALVTLGMVTTTLNWWTVGLAVLVLVVLLSMVTAMTALAGD